jgi:uncharacterized protein (TIGR02145 family)
MTHRRFCLILVCAVLLSSCAREFLNPYDSATPPEAWMPRDLRIDTLGPNSVRLSWQQDELHIDGYLVSRDLSGVISDFIVPLDSLRFSDVEMIDSARIDSCHSVVYSVMARAGMNRSAVVTANPQIFPLATQANAGTDQTFGTSATSASLSANAPAEGETGQWSVVSGTGGSFSDAGSPNATFTAQPFTDYALRWTIAGACSLSSDDMLVSFQQQQGVISALSCGNATNIGTLTAGASTGNVISSVPYTGGNEGLHNGQTVTSTGVTGLTATLSAGSFANGSGSLTYSITGTPSAAGTASFVLNIGGQTCTLNRTVNGITALNCNSATNSGTLTAGTVAIGMSSTVTYIGGNGGSYSSQTVNSSGVSGLTATLSGGSFAIGGGSLTYTITGTPNGVGIASFWLNIGGQGCWLRIQVNGSLTDQNGNVYTTVVIGSQEWMVENLRATDYRNGDPISNVTDNSQWSSLTSGAWVHHNNDSQYDNPFGKLYNWYAVNDPRNVCPAGWHVPTDGEWTVLTDYLGGASVAGGKMKSTGTLSWQSPNTGATNESGFSALPGGARTLDGQFPVFGVLSFGYSGRWWSSTEQSTGNALGRSAEYDDGAASSVFTSKVSGFSVRCIRD